MLRIFVAAALAIAGLGNAASVSAIEVEPVRIEMEPARGVNSVTYTVTNPSPDELPFEVTVERRIIHEDGSQTFEPDDGADFIIFPPQGTISPNGTRAVRVQYIGEVDIPESQGYVMRFSQLPIEREGFTGIQFVYSFGASLYVKPANAVDSIEVRSAVRQDDGVAIEIFNAGNDYSRLTDKELRFSVGGTDFALGGDEIRAMIETPVVPPGSTRRFVLSIEGLPSGEIRDVRFS